MLTFEKYWEKYGELHASFANGSIKQFAKEIWESAISTPMDGSKQSSSCVQIARLRTELEDKINVGCSEFSTDAFRFDLEGEDVVLKVVDDITYNRTGNDYGREYSWPDSWHYGTKEEADELLRVYYQNKKILELADSKNDFKVPFKDFYFDTTDENRQALMFEDGEYECVVPNHSDVRNFENVYYWEANKSWYAVRIRENKEFCQK